MGIPSRIAQLLGATACVAVLIPAFVPQHAKGKAGQVVTVATPAEFQAALGAAQPGDVINLADGDWSALEILDRRYAGTVRVSGSRKARLLHGLTISRSSNITVLGVTVTPQLKPSRADMTPSIVRVQGSSKIVLQNLLVVGEPRVYTCAGYPHNICPEAGAWLEIAGDSSNVTIKGNEIANCRRTCVQTGGNGLTIVDNMFHDSLGGHFIGTIASRVTIRHNTFDRALDPDCTGLECPRGPQGGQHIRISGGAPWTIEGNRFGLNQDAASVRVEPIANPTPIRDVTIASNIFDAMAQGLSGIEIAAAARDEFVPVNTRVVNNTIITKSSAVKLADGWDKRDASMHPIIANNIFKSIVSAYCPRGQYVDNLSMGAEACPGDSLGQANLDPQFRPTASSLLVINQADPRYAPARDYFGRTRVGAPDRGAIEYRS